MRHRPTHFRHIFSADGYAAGYYSYLWSEVLDADAFAAFEESGDIFDPATAKRLHDYVYSAGGSRDPGVALSRFRGRCRMRMAFSVAAVCSTRLQLSRMHQWRSRSES